MADPTEEKPKSTEQDDPEWVQWARRAEEGTLSPDWRRLHHRVGLGELDFKARGKKKKSLKRRITKQVAKAMFPFVVLIALGVVGLFVIIALTDKAPTLSERISAVDHRLTVIEDDTERARLEEYIETRIHELRDARETNDDPAGE